MLYPISFSIPACKIVAEVPEKTQMLAKIIPGKSETYIYKTEAEYYQDYKNSIFGITHKKGGWDCMRHYEILANGCIPYFTDLESCPETILTLFPKKLVKEAMEAATKPGFDARPHIEKLLEFTRANLTTEAMAKYVLEKSGNHEAKSILYISGDDYPDYLRCMTLHGFKLLFGKECHDANCIPHLYDSFPESEMSGLYGGGFSYARLLSRNEMRDDSRDYTLEEDILKHRYDIVIFGSVHRGLPLWDLVTQVYPPDKIIYFCGEDGHTDDEVCLAKSLSMFSPCFLREIE